MNHTELPIGVFDSGVGGISVLRSMIRILPHEDFYYVGDSVNAPYGTKTVEEIRALTLGHARRMADEGIKALVVACNTATSAAIGALRETYPDMPVIGIEPAVKPAALIREDPYVIVMATPGTVHGDKYQDLIQRYEDTARIQAAGCPGLMEFVEAGIVSGEKLENYLRELLVPMDGSRADAIVLGCTHYPFLRSAIRSVVGEHPVIIDGSEGTARQLKRQLEQYGLTAQRERDGRVTFHMTKPGMEPLCRRLLEMDTGNS